MSFAKLSNERLRKHSLQFCSIQSSRVLAGSLKRMESWVQIPGLASNTGARSLSRGCWSSERLNLLLRFVRTESDKFAELERDRSLTMVEQH